MWGGLLFIFSFCAILFVQETAFTRQPSVLPQWEMQDSRLQVSLRGLSAVSTEVAWISGADGWYARTLDGGKTWLPGRVPGADSLDFRDVEAINANHAILMSAGSGRHSRIYSTQDGGKSWQLRYENTAGEGFFNGMAFWDSTHGVLYGDPVGSVWFVLKTDDGGRTWNRIPETALPPLRRGEYGFAASGTGIAVQAGGRIWIASGGAAARVFRSLDAGKSWQVSETPLISGQPSTGIFSIAFRDSLHGIIAGGDYQNPVYDGRTIALTADGGETWELVANAGLGYRSGMAWLRRPGVELLVAVGSENSAYSADGGRHWLPMTGPGFHAVAFARVGIAGWACGANGRVARLQIR